MASFLRARQAGIQTDLSAGIAPTAFNPDELARYGINSQIRYVVAFVNHCYGVPVVGGREEGLCFGGST